MPRTARLLAPLAAVLATLVALPAVAEASPAPPPSKTVSFAASSYTVREDAGNATIAVTRSAGGPKVTVRFETRNGSAVAPRDYTGTLRTLTFPAGARSTTLTVPVPVRNNSVANADRWFTVHLDDPSGGYRLARPSTARVTIVNDDVPAAPSGLTATAVGSNEIDLAWTANSDLVTGYTVSRSTTSGGPYTQIGTSTTNSYQDTGLSAGAYYYVVQAVNPAGTSAPSGEASATLASAQTELNYNGGFEEGLTAGWYTDQGAGTIALDSSGPRSGTYSAHIASDGSQWTYATMESSFIMPSTGTVTFTAWYRAALASGDAAFIALYDADTGLYLNEDDVGSASTWTESGPIVLDASAIPGHYIVVLVGLNANGASTFDLDDVSASVG